MAIKDAGYLRALSDMINSSHVLEEVVPLTEEQKIMKSRQLPSVWKVIFSDWAEVENGHSDFAFNLIEGIEVEWTWPQ